MFEVLIYRLSVSVCWYWRDCLGLWFSCGVGVIYFLGVFVGSLDCCWVGLGLVLDAGVSGGVFGRCGGGLA